MAKQGKQLNRSAYAEARARGDSKAEAARKAGSHAKGADDSRGLGRAWRRVRASLR